MQIDRQNKFKRTKPLIYVQKYYHGADPDVLKDFLQGLRDGK